MPLDFHPTAGTGSDIDAICALTPPQPHPSGGTRAARIAVEVQPDGTAAGMPSAGTPHRQGCHRLAPGLAIRRSAPGISADIKHACIKLSSN